MVGGDACVKKGLGSAGRRPGHLTKPTRPTTGRQSMLDAHGFFAL